jgi:anti-sigma factor RsiW
MKACAANRKLIVCLALNSLDAPTARQLRAHLETCAGCRRYLAEITNVTDRLARGEMAPDLQASENFHRRLAQKLRAAKPRTFGEILMAQMRNPRLILRVALPFAAAAVVVSVIFAVGPRPRPVAAGPSAGPSTTLAARADADLAPTLANYQRTANQSLEKLDALLTRQSKRTLPVTPGYTASTLGLANEPF